MLGTLQLPTQCDPEGSLLQLEHALVCRSKTQHVADLRCYGAKGCFCRSPLTGIPFRVNSTPFMERVQESVTDPAHFYINVMLAVTTLEFAALLPSMMHSQVHT